VPRYVYRCTDCEELSTIIHLSDEVEQVCPKCNAPDGLVKVLTSFRTASPPRTAQSSNVGRVTEEFIQDAREELQQSKGELQKKR
jgi:putative FmdB family regulatory protein